MIQKIGIVGGGVMGADIALLILRDDPAQTPVVIRDIKEEQAKKSFETIRARLISWVSRGTMPDTLAEDKLERQITVTTDIQHLADCDLIIEAVTEDIEIKKRVFAELDGVVKPEAIFASNTSALSITEIAAATTRPDKVMGLHFFNPPTRMRLVEIIPGQNTSEETLAAVEDYARNNITRFSVRVKDASGFLVNRILAAYLLEAGALLETTTLTHQEIDAKADEFGWVAGPFFTLDFLGFKIAMDVCELLHKAHKERMEPIRLLKLLYDMGRKGKDSGTGFYNTYRVGLEGDMGKDLEEILQREYPNRELLSLDEGYQQMMLRLINESIRCLEEGVASLNDIENGAIFGIGFPDSKKGPLHYADELGLDNVLKELEKLQEKHGPRLEPANLLKEMVGQGKLGKKTKKGFFTYAF